MKITSLKFIKLTHKMLTINNLPKLFNKALVEEDLEKVTQAFISIRHLTNSDLPNFDFAKLRKLVNK